jgi:7,8-dihydropterin-6-yl-methyl-4-(beta-D-ribofuranosyl)aminobenzene 5'-phosphate synthase
MKKTIAFLFYTFAFLVSGRIASAGEAPPSAIRHATDAKVTVLSTMLADVDGIGEWGFAALVEVDGYRVLFDTGARPETVLRNAKELNIDLSTVSDVILSHFHGDHTGGLLTLRDTLKLQNPKALSRMHVAKGMFDVRHKEGQTENLNQMIALRALYEAGGGAIIVHDRPAEIAPGVWVTGPVERRFAEHNWSGKLIVTSPAGEAEDNIPEDMSLVVKAREGLVVVTGCGHAGVGNILSHVRAMLPKAPVNTLIGGIHLLDADESKLVWAAEEMRKAGVRFLLAAHCTGIEATYRLRALLKLERRNAVVAAVGSSYTLSKGIDPLWLAR